MNKPKLEKCHIGPWDEVLLNEHGRKCVAILKRQIAELEKENAALNRRAPLLDNKALTVEELREMSQDAHMYVWDTQKQQMFEGMSASLTSQDFRLKTAWSTNTYQWSNYGKTWLAYRSPPEKE